MGWYVSYTKNKKEYEVVLNNHKAQFISFTILKSQQKTKQLTLQKVMRILGCKKIH